MSQCPVLDRCSSEGRASKIAISNVSRVFNHIFQSARQGARSVKYVTVSERFYERRHRRGWSVVKGRSDIYTRPLPLVHSVGCYMVSWWNTETLNIYALLFLSFLPCLLSFSLYLSQSFSSRLVFLLALYHFIPFSLASSSLSPFFFAVLPSPSPPSLPSRVWYRILFYSWTRIMSAWPLPLARPLRFPRVSSCDSPSRVLSPSCFAKRTRSAWMEFYAGCARKNVMAPGMNLDYGNAR